MHRDLAECLRGLARSHDVLVARNREGAPIDELVHSRLAFLGWTDQAPVEIEGNSMLLAPEAVQNVGRALPERATSAIKHGAWTLDVTLGILSSSATTGSECALSA